MGEEMEPVGDQPLDAVQARALIERMKAAASVAMGAVEEFESLALDAYEGQAWINLGYPSFGALAEAEFDVSQSTLYRRLARARIQRELDQRAVLELTTGDDDSRAGKAPDQQERPAKAPSQRDIAKESTNRKKAARDGAATEPDFVPEPDNPGTVIKPNPVPPTLGRNGDVLGSDGEWHPQVAHNDPMIRLKTARDALHDVDPATISPEFGAKPEFLREIHDKTGEALGLDSGQVTYLGAAKIISGGTSDTVADLPADTVLAMDEVVHVVAEQIRAKQRKEGRPMPKPSIHLTRVDGPVPMPALRRGVVAPPRTQVEPNFKKSKR